MDLKVYIAASFPRRDEALFLMACLANVDDIEITSRWLKTNVEEGYEVKEDKALKALELASWAARDYEDVRDAHVLICFTDGEEQLTHGGRHTELGIAMAMDKKIILIGPRESVFHYHSCINHNFRGLCSEMFELLCSYQKQLTSLS